MRVFALAVLALVTTGCADARPFVCDGDADCAAAAAGGLCEANGYCSFPAQDCASGRRFGSHAPGDIAGSCVPPDVADDTSATDPTAVDEAELDSEGGDGDSTAITGADETTHALDDSSSGTAVHTLTTLDDSATSSPSSGDESSTGTLPFEVEYIADIAVCTQDTVFDPVACAAQAGVDQLTVDLSDADGLVANGWLRFELDDALEGADVTSAELVLVVGPDASDGAGSSGELWTAEPFDLLALLSANPSALELVGDDLGVVRLDQTLIWSIPIDLVAAGEPLHFALVPLGTDGMDIWDKNSMTPPRLIVTAQ